MKGTHKGLPYQIPDFCSSCGQRLLELPSRIEEAVLMGQMRAFNRCVDCGTFHFLQEPNASFFVPPQRARAPGNAKPERGKRMSAWGERFWDRDWTVEEHLQSERIMLGAMIINNELLGVTRDILSADSFALRHHNSIYAVMRHQFAQKSPDINLVTIRDGLDHRLGRTGGVAYLSSLVDGVPSMTNAEAHRLALAIEVRR